MDRLNSSDVVETAPFFSCYHFILNEVTLYYLLTVRLFSFQQNSSKTISADVGQLGFVAVTVVRHPITVAT